MAESRTNISIPESGETFYGKTAGDLMEQGARVREDGAVEGRFLYVEGYVGFSDNPEEQKGYYFPFLLTKQGGTDGIPQKRAKRENT